MRKGRCGELPHLSSVAFIFIGPDGPADSCCGGSFIKSRHYSFIFTLIYIGIALWLYFSRRKGILGGTYRVFPGL